MLLGARTIIFEIGLSYARILELYIEVKNYKKELIFIVYHAQTPKRIQPSCDHNRPINFSYSIRNLLLVIL